jgi:hypothetical protein
MQVALVLRLHANKNLGHILLALRRPGQHALENRFDVLLRHDEIISYSFLRLEVHACLRSAMNVCLVEAENVRVFRRYPMHATWPMQVRIILLTFGAAFWVFVLWLVTGVVF